MTASIVLADATRAFDREYTYRVPETMRLKPGMRVLVPFGRTNELRDGWVISVLNEADSMPAHDETGPTQDATGPTDASARSANGFGELQLSLAGVPGLQPPPVRKATRRIKDIAQLVDAEPLLGDDLLRLARWMRDRFFCTWHQALSCMLPSGARLVQKADGTFGRRDAGKTRRAMTPLIAREQFEAMVAEGVFRSLHHVHVLEALFDEGTCPVDELYLLPGVNANTLLTMKKKGWIGETRLETDRDPFACLVVREQPVPDPTGEQENAFRMLEPLLDTLPSTDGFPEALVYGVTGSGKTELYLRLIEACLQRGRGAIMLVPEISLTPQTVERFIGRFGSRVAVLHSRLSIGERYDQWRRIRSGELDVVVGARSAVFAPLARLGAILIDEEHEGAYKAENSPRFDARLVARARCNLTGSLLVYGSATPSIETFHRSEQNKIRRVDLRQRVAGRPLPEVTLVDMRDELARGNRSSFSTLLSQALAANRAAGEQAILFLNRRGLAAFLLCRDCRQVVKCPNCSVSLVLHRKGRLVCHHCGHLQPTPAACPACGTGGLLAIGTGTQRLEQDLTERTDGYRVVRMDLDTTTGKEGHRRQLEQFRAGGADILVGTQMVAKGHDFPNVTLVGILSADAMLASGDYRASERTFQLLAQAAGRAGRAEKPGRVIIQAYNVDDFSLQAVLSHDYEGFYRQEIALRQRLQLPPFTHVGLLLVTAADPKAGESAVRLVARHVAERTEDPGMLLSEPLPAPIPLLNGRHRFRIIARHASVRALQELLSSALDACRKPLAALEADLTVDIDPGSLT